MSLNTLIKSKPALNLIKTISFYIILAVTIPKLDKLSPTGPCSPGLGILLFMLAIPIVITLVYINLCKIYKGDRYAWPSAAIHGTALLLFCVIL